MIGVIAAQAFLLGAVVFACWLITRRDGPRYPRNPFQW